MSRNRAIAFLTSFIAALAMTLGLTVGALANTVLPYPTQGEALKKAADQWRKRKLTPSAKRLLRLWFWMTK